MINTTDTPDINNNKLQHGQSKQHISDASATSSTATTAATGADIYPNTQLRRKRSANLRHKKAQQLIQFFKDLEFLFMQGGVTSEVEKKEMVLQYVKLELEEAWGWYPDFKDQTKTYHDFKDAILAHYPESFGEFLYSLSDIDILVGDWFRNGIRTLEDLTDYHNRFEAISSWLF